MITRWRLRPAYTPVATPRPCYTTGDNGQHPLAAEHELSLPRRPGTALNPDLDPPRLVEAPNSRPTETAIQHDVPTDAPRHRPAQRLNQVGIIDQRVQRAHTSTIQIIGPLRPQRLGALTVAGSNHLREKVAERTPSCVVRLPAAEVHHVRAISEGTGGASATPIPPSPDASKIGQLRIRAPLRRNGGILSGCVRDDYDSGYVRLTTRCGAQRDSRLFAISALEG